MHVGQRREEMIDSLLFIEAGYGDVFAAEVYWTRLQDFVNTRGLVNA